VSVGLQGSAAPAHVTTEGLQQACQQIEQGGFAGTVRADERQRVAASGRERDIAQHFIAAVCRCQMSDSERVSPAVVMAAAPADMVMFCYHWK
jgi:hypothetical protein